MNTSLQHLKDHIIKRLGQEPEQLDEVLYHFEPVAMKRNAMLLRQVEVCRNVYYVAQGCLQVFMYDNEGNETTRDIVTEGNWCAELISFGSGSPAAENIRTVENCSLLAINKENFSVLMTTIPQFDKVYKQILEASYANSVYRINTFVALNALDRLKWLMRYRPGLMSRLSSKLIASYLGISQETLSRLKTRL